MGGASLEVFRNIEIFVAVAKAQGFRPAALALGIPNSTVSRRIAELERDIGLRLFNRTTRQVEMTEAGLIYFDRCKGLISEAYLAQQELMEIAANPSGLIRASLPVDFAVPEITKIIADFLFKYPAIRFQLDLSPRQSDLISDPVDFTVRIGPAREPNLIARKIAELPSVLYASPDYLSRAGIPQFPEDLAKHASIPILGKDWCLFPNKGGEPVYVAARGPVIANNVTWIKRLAMNDLGIFACPPHMVAAEVAAGHLVAVLPDWAPASTPVFALTETRLLPARVRLFLEFLTARLSQA